MSKIKYNSDSFIFKILNYKPIVFASNFVFQGMRYMEAGERTFKLAITLIIALLLFVIGVPLILSIIIAHAVNYIINGQFYVVYRYLSSNEVLNKEELERYNVMVKKLATSSEVLDVLYIGSFCRGNMKRTSDLDIRIYHGPSISDRFNTYLLAMKLRFLGLFYKFPVDVYCFSNLDFIKNIRQDEVPDNMFSHKDILDIFPTSEKIERKIERMNFND